MRHERFTFDKCDFTKAVFSRTNLEIADFSTSKNCRINTGTNRIAKVRFSYPDEVGLLYDDDILMDS